SACRTALCKARKGGFKDTHPDDLLAPVLKAVADIAAAIKAGFYDIGMVFCGTLNLQYYFLKVVDPKTGEHKQVTVSVDEGIRPDTSISVLSKLKPAFKKDGTTTAGQKHIVCEFWFLG
ncbi:hypothetical protein GW17_00027703, partial [Ensete ventricosum]